MNSLSSGTQTMHRVDVEPLLRVINLSKRFGTLPVVQNVSFELYPGEVVGLAGRSGAGKSVLALMVAGLETPSGGDIYLSNRRLQWPFSARDLEIEVIHQEPILVEDLDITGNIFLGREIGWPTDNKFLMVPNRQLMEHEATRILAMLGVRFPSLRLKVSNLTSEQKQLITIARALTYTPKLIFIDEPTALLSYSNQQILLSLIQNWQQQGVTIIFGSNNLDHLFDVSDRIIVLRQGRQVAAYRTDETTREEIVGILLDTTNQQQFTPAIWALDSYYRAREQAEQLRYQQSLLEKDLVAQDALNQQLIEQLAKQVTALDKANLALQAAQRRLWTERELERKHLARELHDMVIQDLLSTNYQLEELEDREALEDFTKDKLADVRRDIKEMVEDLRRICGGLRPPTIDSLGLGAALQSYTHTWSERTGVEVALSLDASMGRMPETIELSIFRIVQEALSNVRKHAQATAVTVTLTHTSPRMLKISIADNGKGMADGFDLSALTDKGHYGLLGVSERVALLGGRLNLKNQRSGGVLLEVEIPHPRVSSTFEMIDK